MVSRILLGGLLALTLGIAGNTAVASAAATPAPSASCVTLTDALDSGVNADAFDVTEDCDPTTAACPPGQVATPTHTVATRGVPARTVTRCVTTAVAPPAAPTPTPLSVPTLEAPKLDTPTLPPPAHAAPAAPAPRAPAATTIPVPADPTAGKTSTPVRIPAPAPAVAAARPQPAVSHYAAADPVAPTPQAQIDEPFPTGWVLAAGGVALAGWILLGRRRAGAAEEAPPVTAETTPQP